MLLSEKNERQESRLQPDRTPQVGGRLRLLQLGAEWQNEVPGGVNRYTFGVAREFARRGIEQQWIVAADNPLPPSPVCKVIAAANSKLWLPRRLMRFNHLVRRSISNCNCAVSHFALYAYAALSSVDRKPHVVHFHGPWAEESAIEGGNELVIRAKYLIEKRVYRAAARCIALSSAFARVLAENYGVQEDRIRIVPGGIDPDEWNPPQDRRQARAELGWPQDRPIVFCVRRLTQRMGLDSLIEAAALLRQRRNDVLVVVGGRGPLHEQLQASIQSLGLHDHVQLAGYIHESKLPLAYRAADLSIVPSRALEGFGLTALESLAAGTPVLVSPVGGLPEVVAGLDRNLILASTSPNSIAERIESCTNNELMLPSAEDCQQYVCENFEWSIVADKLLHIYTEAAELT